MLITLKCLHNIPACHKPLPARPLHFTPSRMEASGFSDGGTWLAAAAVDGSDHSRVPRGVRNLTGARVLCPRLSSALYAEGVYELHRLAGGWGGRGRKGQGGASWRSGKPGDRGCGHVFVSSSAAPSRPCERLGSPALKMGVAKGSSWVGSAKTPGKRP